MKTIAISKNDALETEEILYLTGLDANRLAIPRVASQIQAIVKHFAGQPDSRYSILKVLMKPGDKLENLWTYVQLQVEKRDKFELLNPDDFEPDIVEEIMSGYLTIQSKEKIRNDIKKQKDSLGEGESLEKLELYDNVLKDLDMIDNQLNRY